MDLQLIKEKYQLNTTEFHILTYLYTHRQTLKAKKIREIAELLYLSPSAIINMCKKIGYSGYTELVYDLTRPTAIQLNNRLISPQQSRQFTALLQQAQNSRMMLLASGYSNNLTNYMAEKLNYYGYRATANSHLEYIFEKEHTNCLLFFISESGETNRLCELAQMNVDHHHPSIAFTGCQQSTLAQSVDLVISTDTYSAFNHDYIEPHLFYGIALLQFEWLLANTLNDSTRT